MIRKFLFWLKVKKFQGWKPIRYGDVSRFNYWSEKVVVKGIKEKKKALFVPGRKWTGIVVLKPLGYSNASFNIGYSFNKENITEITNTQRKVRDGAFMMRITKNPCSLFVASNDSRVSLVFMGYGNLETDLPLY